MPVLRVDPSGLEALADECNTLAAAISSSSSSGNTASGARQATPVAVARVASEVQRASARFAARVQDTGDKLLDASAQYADADHNAASAITNILSTFEA